MRGAEHAYEWVLKNKPDALVLWTDTYPEHRGAIIAARELGIPSIEVIHGHTHPIRPGAIERKDWASHKLVTEGYQRWHEFYGKGPATLVRTGSPSHDIFAGADLPSLRLIARHELELPEHAAVVTWLCDVPFSRSAWSEHSRTSWAFGEFLKSWAILRDIVPNLFLIVKLHPRETVTVQRYQHVLAKFGIKDNFIVMTDPLITAIAASDLMIGPRTSAFADALMLEVPCVCLAYEPFFEVPLLQEKGVMFLRSPEEVLGRLTEVLLGTEGMKALLERTTDGAWYFAGAVDGGATRRAIMAIDSIARGRNVPESCEHAPISQPYSNYGNHQST